jgi:crotonobetainyl-CoA:carnitine CoA-transferase CaiB-like acyl-CoA transferase
VFDLLNGTRVVELAQWVMVPSSAALLADLGADVIKIEQPARGDPYRGIRTAALRDGAAGESPSVAHTNRGKRSLGLDVKCPAGRAVLVELLRTADVLLTSLRVPAMHRIGLDPDSVREINPRLVYARANAFGYDGPDSDAGGYDATAYWSRGGFAHSLTPVGAEYPVQMRPALGDRTTALAIAMGVCAALVKRERTGAGSVVDVSLMGTANWVLAGDLLAALTAGVDPVQDPERSHSTNPLTNTYRTRDGRWISLVGMQPDRYWDGFCAAIGRPDLALDPRYASMASRAENAATCIAELDAVFAQADLGEWRDRLAGFDGPWAPVQGALEIVEDPQTKANEWIVQLDDSGQPAYAIAGPVRVRGGDSRLRRAPAVGEHTEQVLLELGKSWEEIAALKADQAVT